MFKTELMVKYKVYITHFLGDFDVLLPVEPFRATVWTQSQAFKWSFLLPYLRTISLAIFSVIVTPVLSASLRIYSKDNFPQLAQDWKIRFTASQDKGFPFSYFQVFKKSQRLLVGIQFELEDSLLIVLSYFLRRRFLPKYLLEAVMAATGILPPQFLFRKSIRPAEGALLNDFPFDFGWETELRFMQDIRIQFNGGINEFNQSVFDISQQKEDVINERISDNGEIRIQIIININIQKSMIKTLAIMAILTLYSSNALYFGITGKPFCFDIEEQPGKTIKFFYEVTGEKPQETQVHIVSANQNNAVSLKGASNKTEQSGDSSLNVCFVSTDGGYKSVSVDFYTHDKAHLLELAKKSQIYELHTKLIDVGQGLKEISKNQHFEEQRQKIHAQIITQHENKVKNFAVIKLLAIVVVAVGQLYLLKKMLDKQGQGYQPV